MHKDFLDQKKQELESHKSRLDREKENNRGTEGIIVQQERVLAKTRETLARSDEEKKSLEGEVVILRNQLSAFATELNNKRANVAAINKVLEEKMQRLDAAKKRHAGTKDRLAREQNQQYTLEKANQVA